MDTNRVSDRVLHPSHYTLFHFYGERGGVKCLLLWFRVSFNSLSVTRLGPDPGPPHTSWVRLGQDQP